VSVIPSLISLDTQVSGSIL